MNARLPDDNNTLNTFLDIALVSSGACQVPTSFGKLEAAGTNGAGTAGGKQLRISVPDGHDLGLFSKGEVVAIVTKFAPETGVLPGSPVDSCPSTLPSNPAAPCTNFYESSSGRQCQHHPTTGECIALGHQLRPEDRRDNLCVVSVKGTDPSSWSNISLDLNIGHTALPPEWVSKACTQAGEACTAHSGFADVAQKLLPKVDKALQDFGCQEVVFTGHSLGGAVSTLLGYAAKKEHPDLYRVEGSYTFSAPRYANSALARSMELDGFQVIRTVRDGDPVPSLPWVKSNFVHEGKEIFFDDRGNRRETTSSWEHEVAPYKDTHKGRELFALNLNKHNSFGDTALKNPFYSKLSGGCPWPPTSTFIPGRETAPRGPVPIPEGDTRPCGTLGAACCLPDKTCKPYTQITSYGTRWTADVRCHPRTQSCCMPSGYPSGDPGICCTGEITEAGRNERVCA